MSSPRHHRARRVRVQAIDARAMSGAQLLRARMEEDAERIFEKVLGRRRWAAVDRDALASALGAIVRREAAAVCAEIEAEAAAAERQASEVVNA